MDEFDEKCLRFLIADFSHLGKSEHSWRSFMKFKTHEKNLRSRRLKPFSLIEKMNVIFPLYKPPLTLNMKNEVALPTLLEYNSLQKNTTMLQTTLKEQEMTPTYRQKFCLGAGPEQVWPCDMITAVRNEGATSDSRSGLWDTLRVSCSQAEQTQGSQWGFEVSLLHLRTLSFNYCC